MTRGLGLAAFSLAACTDQVTVAPVIDTPVEDPRADAFATVDQIELEVAHAGDPSSLATHTFRRGETLELDGVPFADDLVIHMTGNVSRDAYGRSCTFSLRPDEAPPAPHLFFSVSAPAQFSRTSLFAVPREGGGALSYLGSSLILGGMHAGSPVREVERFDPMTGELDVVATVRERQDAVAALIGTNPLKVAVIGGSVSGVGAGFIETITPGRESPVDEISDDRIGRINLTATTLTDGRVIAIGGNAPGTVPVGTITEVAIAGELKARDLRPVLVHPRSGHTATRLGNDPGAPVLIVGGIDSAGAPVPTAELFLPSRDALADAATFAPAMVVPRTRHQAVLLVDGSVLIIGGIDALGAPVHVLEKFTLYSGFEEVTQRWPQGAGVVDMTTTTLADGRILITGGRVDGNPLTPATSTAFLVNLADKERVDVAPANDPLSFARAGHQAALLCDGTVLVTGGATEGAYAERYNPWDVGRR